jgi:hypothetical protein
MKASDNFYVYAYLDPRKPGKYVYGEYVFDYGPFYIGKGFDNRMYIHLTESINGLKDFYKIHNLNAANMINVVNKKRKTCQGWKCEHFYHFPE